MDDVWLCVADLLKTIDFPQPNTRRNLSRNLKVIKICFVLILSATAPWWHGVIEDWIYGRVYVEHQTAEIKQVEV